MTPRNVHTPICFLKRNFRINNGAMSKRNSEDNGTMEVDSSKVGATKPLLNHRYCSGDLLMVALAFCMAAMESTTIPPLLEPPETL